MREFLNRYGIDFYRLGVYEFTSIRLPWFSDEWRTILEIELTKEHKGGHYGFRLILVAGVEGIVERTVVLAATFDDKFQLKEIFLAKNMRENIIPDTDGLEYSEQYNVYVTRDSPIFIITLERLLNRLTTREPLYLGSI